MLIYPALIATDSLARKTLKSRAGVWLVGGKLFVAATVFLIINTITSSIDYAADRNEALDIAVREAVSARYPYDLKTQLGNPLSPLPGALLLALPFVLLGGSAYQNFFWLAIFLMVAQRQSGLGQKASAVMWAILLSPLFLQEIVYGGDLLANNIYLLLAVLWIVLPVERQAAAPILPLIFFGIALSSRFNSLLYLPMVGMFLVNRIGMRSAAVWLSVSLIVFAAITLPFYFYAPGAFSPLHATGKLKVEGLPDLSAAILLFTAIVSLWVSKNTRTVNDVMRNAAIVQAMPIGLVVVADLVVNRSTSILGYGLNVVVPGAMYFFSSFFDKKVPLS